VPNAVSDSLLFNFKENYRQNYYDYLQAKDAYNLSVLASDSAKISANLIKSNGFKESSDFINSNIILAHLSKKYHADSARTWIGKLNTLESDYFVADFLSERSSYQAADSFLYNVSQSRNLSSEQLMEITQLRNLIDIIKNKYVYDLDSFELVQLRNCTTSTNNFATSIKYNLLSMVGVFEDFEYTLPSGIGERNPII
jgi:hypothetical protein